jgi:hypothetical protein
VTVNSVNAANGSSGAFFGKVKNFFATMNRNELAHINQGGKLVAYEVPQGLGLGKLFPWAFDPKKTGPLKTIFGGLVRGGFKLLQLPIVRSISPFMKFNLLFGAGLAILGSAYKVLTGRVTEGVHGLVGNTVALGATTAAAFAIPKMLGMSLVGGPAAWIGFGLTMFLEPQIRKLVGLDKKEGEKSTGKGNGIAGLLDGSPTSQLGNLLSSQVPISSMAASPYAAAYAQNPYAAASVQNAYNPWMQQQFAAQQAAYQEQLLAQQATQQAAAQKQQLEMLDEMKAQKTLQDIQKSLSRERRIS